jgi:hypothetical protein
VTGDFVEVAFGLGVELDVGAVAGFDEEVQAGMTAKRATAAITSPDLMMVTP